MVSSDRKHRSRALRQLSSTLGALTLHPFFNALLLVARR